MCDGVDEEENDDDDAHGAAAAIRVMLLLPPLLLRASLRRREAHAVHARTHTLPDDAQGVPSPTRNPHERTLTPSWPDAVWRTSTRKSAARSAAVWHEAVAARGRREK